MVQVDHNFQKPKGHALSSASAPMPRNTSEYNVKNLHNFKPRPSQSQGCVEQGRSWAPTCANCGGNYPDKCHDGLEGFFKSGQEGHFMRESPKNKQGVEI